MSRGIRDKGGRDMGKEVMSHTMMAVARCLIMLVIILRGKSYQRFEINVQPMSPAN